MLTGQAGEKGRDWWPYRRRTARSPGRSEARPCPCSGTAHPHPKTCGSRCERRRSTTSTASPRGLVRIDVVVPPDMRDDLHADEERELEQRYGLTEAVVAGHGIDIGAPGRPAAYASVGRAAAALLMRR